MSRAIALEGHKKVGVGDVPNTIRDTVTLAELNADKKIVRGYGVVRRRVTGIKLRFNGAFASGTDMRIQTDEATPTVIATVLVANMGDGDKWDETSAEVVLGAGFDAKLKAGAAINVVATGSAMTGGTDVKVTLTYRNESGLSAVPVAA